MGTCLNVMMTLPGDKHHMVRNDLPYVLTEVPERSTLHQLSAPGNLHVSWKAPLPITTTRQDGAWQVGHVPSAVGYEP
jgi:hypothetical protein